MERLNAISCIEDVIAYYKDLVAEVPEVYKKSLQESITCYEVLKQYRQGEKPTQKVNRKRLDADVRRITKEIKDFLSGYITIGFAPNAETFCSKYAPLNQLQQLELLRDLQSYLDTGRSFDAVMLDKIYGKK